MNKFSLILAAFLLSLGVASSGYFVGYAIGENKTFNRYVTVKGLAEKTVEADFGIWRLEFSYASDDLKDVYQGIADTQKKAKEFFIQQGFGEAELQIEPVSITDHQSTSYSSNEKSKRYSASIVTVLSSHNIKTVETAVQKTSALVEQGVVLKDSLVRYLFINLNQVKPEMLTRATNNAHQAAETFAKNSNSQLGGIRRATQGLFSINNANGLYGETDPMKKVRVVTTVQYFLG